MREVVVEVTPYDRRAAQSDVPVRNHLDFDSYCGWFAEGSAAVRIELE